MWSGRSSVWWRAPVIVGVAGSLVALGVFPVVGAVGLAIVRADRLLFARPNVPMVLPPLPAGSTIYAADGTVLAHVWSQYDRHVVPLSRVAPVARQAVLAAEDHGFYRHGAIDVASII